MAAPTKTFTLNPNFSTLLSAAIPNPGGRVYVRIDNLDKPNWIAFAHGTNNQATAQHHQIPPGSFYEFRWPPNAFFVPQPGWGLTLDISAIAITGNPIVAYTES
jgi:hypothetical protein